MDRDTLPAAFCAVLSVGLVVAAMTVPISCETQPQRTILPPLTAVASTTVPMKAPRP